MVIRRIISLGATKNIIQMPLVKRWQPPPLQPTMMALVFPPRPFQVCCFPGPAHCRRRKTSSSLAPAAASGPDAGTTALDQRLVMPRFSESVPHGIVRAPPQVEQGLPGLPAQESPLRGSAGPRVLLPQCRIRSLQEVAGHKCDPERPCGRCVRSGQACLDGWRRRRRSLGARGS